MEETIADEIDHYIQYANKKKEKSEISQEEKIEKLSEDEENPKEEKVYKYYRGSMKDLDIPTGRDRMEVKKEIEEVTEGDKAFAANPKFDPDGDPNIEEITEDLYIEGSDEYEQTTLNYIFGTDELFYGYETDNQELAESHFNVGREAIIGQLWRYASDYTNNESGIGVTYIRNHKLKYDFEVIIHVDLDNVTYEG